MKKYLRFILFVLLIIFFTGTSLVGQDSADIPIIQLILQNNPTTVWQSETLVNLRDQTESISAELSYAQQSQVPQISAIFSSRDISGADDVAFFVDPVNDISPLLNLNISFYVREAYSQETQDQLLNLAVRYAISDCDDIQESPENLNLLRIDTFGLTLNCAILDGDYVQAIQIYEEWDFLPGDDSGIANHLNVAWLYLQLGMVDRTFAIMDEYVALYETYGSSVDTVDGYITVLTTRAQLHALNFDYDSAIADMDSAIALDADNPELYVLRGQMVILLYEWNRVAENYNTALEIDPNYAPAYFYRGILYYTNLFREDALADFERYLEISPHGEHAADAARYAESIRAEIAALND